MARKCLFYIAGAVLQWVVWFTALIVSIRQTGKMIRNVLT
jgi:hypothetical protein